MNRGARWRALIERHAAGRGARRRRPLGGEGLTASAGEELPACVAVACSRSEGARDRE
jgi:hypothetical protein